MQIIWVVTVSHDVDVTHSHDGLLGRSTWTVYLDGLLGRSTWTVYLDGLLGRSTWVKLESVPVTVGPFSVSHCQTQWQWLTTSVWQWLATIQGVSRAFGLRSFAPRSFAPRSFAPRSFAPRSFAPMVNCPPVICPLVGHSHPTVWTLIDALRRDCATAESDIFLDNRGQPPAKRVRRTTVRLQDQLRNLCLKYDAGNKSLSATLQEIGHCIRLAWTNCSDVLLTLCMYSLSFSIISLWWLNWLYFALFDLIKKTWIFILYFLIDNLAVTRQ